MFLVNGFLDCLNLRFDFRFHLLFHCFDLLVQCLDFLFHSLDFRFNSFLHCLNFRLELFLYFLNFLLHRSDFSLNFLIRCFLVFVSLSGDEASNHFELASPVFAFILQCLWRLDNQNKGRLEVNLPNLQNRAEICKDRNFLLQRCLDSGLHHSVKRVTHHSNEHVQQSNLNEDCHAYKDDPKETSIFSDKAVSVEVAETHSVGVDKGIHQRLLVQFLIEKEVVVVVEYLVSLPLVGYVEEISK